MGRGFAVAGTEPRRLHGAQRGEQRKNRDQADAGASKGHEAAVSGCADGEPTK